MAGEKGMFGKGVYLAERSAKADQYMGKERQEIIHFSFIECVINSVSLNCHLQTMLSWGQS